MAGGFRGPLLPLALAAAVTTQGGFNSPLPVPPIAGGGVTQAGFIGPLPLVNLGAGEAAPEVVEEPLGGNSQDFRRRQDDELILTFVMTVISEVN